MLPATVAAVVRELLKMEVAAREKMCFAGVGSKLKVISRTWRTRSTRLSVRRLATPIRSCSISWGGRFLNIISFCITSACTDYMSFRFGGLFVMVAANSGGGGHPWPVVVGSDASQNWEG
ncbi:hypothetical protein PVAP13_9NG577128 [Panicum virgatum]|uniref:Uncharacterized protein n=1 Tax=Panicum virgatum TaxID=38727 RepID=A0A8T0MV67_PANVG|nr:hypothetical protein PVAP13_9NG577128 [Panicum virgatum]